MGKSTKQAAETARFRQDIRSLLRTRVREAIEITLEEELAEALGCGRYERSGFVVSNVGCVRLLTTTLHGLTSLLGLGLGGASTPSGLSMVSGRMPRSHYHLKFSSASTRVKGYPAAIQSSPCRLGVKKLRFAAIWCAIPQLFGLRLRILGFAVSADSVPLDGKTFPGQPLGRAL